MSKLHLVGIGPGSREYLTFKARKTVESSDIIIGSGRALELFSDVEAEKLVLGVRNMDEMLKVAVSKACEGNSVALLSTGDPGFSGLLKPILKLAGELELEIVPGVSSVQLCAAKLNISWDEANIITMHGKGISKEILNMLANGKPTIIIPNKTIEEITRFLIENGVDPKRDVAVCEKLSYSDERIKKTILKNLLNEKFGYMCVLVVY
ncbi:MAG TPA: precorrin-6y C5,15-methyltransferase (decarboxylating) subunit CbiE [Methanobacterium sp.]|nr:precorrin-6y C5,15-methyltransferase (decarboxylating) subunit CbiE [Methanobacterium sp.]